MHSNSASDTIKHGHFGSQCTNMLPQYHSTDTEDMKAVRILCENLAKNAEELLEISTDTPIAYKNWYAWAIRNVGARNAELLAAHLKDPVVNAWAVATGLVTKEGKPCIRSIK
jgi:hypothetical protein